jgi:hypothetical protein
LDSQQHWFKTITTNATPFISKKFKVSSGPQVSSFKLFLQVSSYLDPIPVPKSPKSFDVFSLRIFRIFLEFTSPKSTSIISKNSTTVNFGMLKY